MKLSECVAPQARFSRSVNVERDTCAGVIDGYLPTGRALDVVRRVARSLAHPGAGRAFSITGPHGSGKSSLAVFLAGLTAPADTDEFDTAVRALDAVEPEAAELLREARSGVGATKTGFVRCVVTANREPVLNTVARGLAVGARRFFGNRRANPIPGDWSDPGFTATLTPLDIREKLSALAAHAPVLLIIDEFGKNLEAYSDSGRDGDPYLLQALAEWAGGDPGERLVVITMQHLAFEEYVHETSAARRREWVKVQGRFEDIAYVETASQSRRLIAAAFDRRPGRLDRAVHAWAKRQHAAYAGVGLRELFDEGVVSSAYPVHPVALAALPELCSRYGQNERTLFSFLAGPEPSAAPDFLREAVWDPGGALPFVRLAQIYDYFVASAATMISSAAGGGRWVEIESRIRDTSGLSGLELRTLKSIGLLNLISAGGRLRASHALLGLALADEPESGEVLGALRRLEERGLVTYRDFADEYRIWQGSDFDLRGTVDMARRRCAGRALDELLNEAAPAAPLVAARHSQQHGTLRVFERRFSRLTPDDLMPPPASSEWDGRVLLAVQPQIPAFDCRPDDKPLVVVVPESVDALREAAVDAAALAEALRSADALSADWVARRELVERFAVAQQHLQHQVDSVFEARATKWHLLGSDMVFESGQGPSRVLSDVADHVYSATPPVANEMVARRELTSQGAKARRLLIEAMLSRPTSPHLAIDGFPAERAMYEAVLARPGLHVTGIDARAGFQPPTDPRYQVAWGLIDQAFERATAERVEVIQIWRALQAPPIGLKDGPIPILLVVALLLRQDDVALYEHGTLTLALDDAVAERFVRNPAHFSVKNTAATSAARKEAIAKIATRLGFASYAGAPTFLGVARQLFAQLRRLEPYAMATKTVSPTADAMRKAFRSAAEPDRLLFHDLPLVLGCTPVPPSGKVPSAAISRFVEALGEAVDELGGAYTALLDLVGNELARALAEPREHLRRSFSVHAAALAESVLEPRLRSLVHAACRDELDDREWLENLAMVVADAQAPKNWHDETVERFRLAAMELGGAFRRVSALLSERKALADDHVAARPIAITRLDGKEARLVLWATEDERRTVASRLRMMLDDIAPLFGSSEKAREVVLAELLDERADPGDGVVALKPATGSARSVQSG